MKDKFRGWMSVYAFTFQQTTKSAGFKLVTALIALLIMAGFIVMNVAMAKPDKDKKNEPSPIKTVYVLDNSKLQPTDYKGIISQLKEKQFHHVEFVAAAGQSTEQVVKAAEVKSSEAIVVVTLAKDSGYEIKGIIPQSSNIKKKQAEELLETMSSAFKSNKLMQAGLSAEQLTSVLKPVVVNYSEVGESTSDAAKMIKMIAPMIFSFMLYFMLLIYGQNISKSVSTEKTSKLMEVLLTSVHPYAMIAGKVLAVTTIAIMQFVTWIAAVFVGLYGGNAIAHRIYPEYENTVITIFNFLKENIGETAMTLPAVVLAVILLFIGFLFYCTLAAVAGSMVSKPEDVATTQAVFQIPVVFSWIVCYFAPILDKNGLITVARYIPLTAPFSVPVDLITGTISLAEGMISLALLLIFSLLTIILAARIYKGLVLYNGQKLSFKVIGNILKTNK